MSPALVRLRQQPIGGTSDCYYQMWRLTETASQLRPKTKKMVGELLGVKQLEEWLTDVRGYEERERVHMERQEEGPHHTLIIFDGERAIQMQCWGVEKRSGR